MASLKLLIILGSVSTISSIFSKASVTSKAKSSTGDVVEPNGCTVCSNKFCIGSPIQG